MPTIDDVKTWQGQHVHGANGDKLEFKQGDALKIKDWSDASVVLLYLGDHLNEALRPSLQKTLRPGSRIVSRTPQELRRPAKSQMIPLTHRDGNGEILFGLRLEYAQMQTCITYRHAPGLWKTEPGFGR